MNFTAIDLGHDGQGLGASATSAEHRLAVRERSVRPTFPGSTGEMRPLAGAFAMTPTADIQDPARVRSWSPPV
jgi:hypothetical protein